MADRLTCGDKTCPVFRLISAVIPPMVISGRGDMSRL